MSYYGVSTYFFASIRTIRGQFILPLLPLFPHKLVDNVQIAVEVEAGGLAVEVSAGLAFVEQLQRLWLCVLRQAQIPNVSQ